jgi:hypothetical protein
VNGRLRRTGLAMLTILAITGTLPACGRYGRPVRPPAATAAFAFEFEKDGPTVTSSEASAPLAIDRDTAGAALASEARAEARCRRPLPVRRVGQASGPERLTPPSRDDPGARRA